MNAGRIALDGLMAFAVVVILLGIAAEREYQDEQAIRREQAERQAARERMAQQVTWDDLDIAGRVMTDFDRIVKK